MMFNEELLDKIISEIKIIRNNPGQKIYPEQLKIDTVNLIPIFGLKPIVQMTTIPRTTLQDWRKKIAKNTNEHDEVINVTRCVFTKNELPIQCPLATFTKNNIEFKLLNESFALKIIESLIK